LAAILEFAVVKQQKTTITSDSGFGRVFMLAGAGFAQDLIDFVVETVSEYRSRFSHLNGN